MNTLYLAYKNISVNFKNWITVTGFWYFFYQSYNIPFNYFEINTWIQLPISIISSFVILIFLVPLEIQGTYLKMKASNDFASVLKFLFLNWKSFVFTNFLMTIIAIGYTLLLILPGIIKVIQLIFTNILMIEKNLFGKEAIKESKRISKLLWWKLSFYVILLSLISYGLMHLFDDYKTNFFLHTFVSSAIQILFGSFTSVVWGVLYRQALDSIEEKDEA